MNTDYDTINEHSDYDTINEHSDYDTVVEVLLAAQRLVHTVGHLPHSFNQWT